MRRRQFLLAAAAASPQTVMVVAADARWLECCAGLLARHLAQGLRGLLVRVGDDRLEGWNMPPEQAAWRNRLEAEAAAKTLGLAEVVSFGYPAGELRNVPHTTLRDRLITLIRRHRPAILVIPNPHTEHDRNLDSYYAGAAAEDAWHAARFANYLPALALEPYLTPEVYYYAPPVDPRRREPEAAAAFVPQPVQVDISPWFSKKLAAARALGVTELFSLNHKSGELAQVSSNELRNQITVLIRTWKPQKLFFPDPYVHYTPEWDQFFTGRAAEETNYSNSGSFLYEFARAGLKGYSVPETYYYAVGRPYRPGEGGHNGARMEKFNITPLMARKRAAVAELRTANRAYAEHTRARLAAAGKPLGPLASLTDTAAADLAIAWVDELSAAVGARYGLPFAEEFNYHGAAPGEKRPLPAWIEERARPLP